MLTLIPTQTHTQCKKEDFFYRQHLLIYRQLLIQIRRCDKMEKDIISRIEHCFNITMDYIKIISKGYLLNKGLSDTEEILFFKKIKPLFIARLQFYKLLYFTSLIVKLITDPDELRDFWMKQVKKLDRFKQKNADFYNYYIKGRTENDRKWFTKAQVKSIDCPVNSTHDGLVAEYIALTKLAAYANKMLQSEQLTA